MSTQIVVDKNVKEQIKNKLQLAYDTTNDNIMRLNNLYDAMNILEENPELFNIKAELLRIMETKHVSKCNIENLKEKMDLNIDKIISLDNEMSKQFKGW